MATMNTRRRIAERALGRAGVVPEEGAELLDALDGMGYAIVPVAWMEHIDALAGLADNLDRWALELRAYADAHEPGAVRAGFFGKAEGVEAAAKLLRELGDAASTAQVGEAAAFELSEAMAAIAAANPAA